MLVSVPATFLWKKAFQTFSSSSVPSTLNSWWLKLFKRKQEEHFCLARCSFPKLSWTTYRELLKPGASLTSYHLLSLLRNRRISLEARHLSLKWFVNIYHFGLTCLYTPFILKSSRPKAWNFGSFPALLLQVFLTWEAGGWCPHLRNCCSKGGWHLLEEEMLMPGLPSAPTVCGERTCPSEATSTSLYEKTSHSGLR